VIEHPTASAQQLQDFVAAGFSRGVIPSLAHYRTPEQSAAWRAVATSFFDRAPGRSAFDDVYTEIAENCPGTPVHVIALGCGDGSKEEALVRNLCLAGLDVAITLADVSPSLLQLAGARQEAIENVRVLNSIACDVTTVGGSLADLIEYLPGRRVITMFGVLPGLTTMSAFESVASLMRDGDLFAFSGNMLPDGAGEIERLCDFYATGSAHDWMALVFSGAGIDTESLSWSVAPAYTSEVFAVATVSVKAEVLRDCVATVGDHAIQLEAGQTIDTFRSHRHSSESLTDLLESLGMKLICLQLSDSGEEGVVLARK